jgi:hypothetical protein
MDLQIVQFLNYPIEMYDNSMSTQHMSSLERKSKIEARDKIRQWTIGV